MLIYEVGPERIVQRRRVRPAHHLVLKLGIGDAIKEFPEAVNLVAFGDNDEDRKAHVEHALNHIQLLRDLAGLALDVIGRVLDQAVGRNDEQQPVDRAVGTVLLEER